MKWLKRDAGDASAATDIVLEEPLDIRKASELSRSLIEALDAGKPIRIRADGVQHADTAALQLLLAFCRQIESDGIDVSWQGMAPAIGENARLLGIEEELSGAAKQ